jgi:hypothetical protein
VRRTSGVLVTWLIFFSLGANRVYDQDHAKGLFVSVFCWLSPAKSQKLRQTA